LFHHEGPLLKIPTLAIHLSTDRAKFEPNNETHLRPVFSSEAYNKLTGKKLKIKKIKINWIKSRKFQFKRSIIINY